MVSLNSAHTGLDRLSRLEVTRFEFVPLGQCKQIGVLPSAPEAPAEPSFARRVETPQAWKVPVEQVQANGYNFDIKNPHDTSVAHTDPDELLADYQLLMTELQQTRDRLKEELFSAINRTI